MSRDFLILLAPGFTDPQKPGRRYFCPDCNQIEGVLASNPGLAGRITVKRVSFLRPRAEVVALLGPDNQGLPVLILGDAAPLPADAQAYGTYRFVTDTRRILELIAERHGVPFPH
ncbi:MAG: DUF3088 domain-containing protein [Rhizobiales bacterium]|uniref:DUF3088 domain-containing protein n=1 Tax=Xanthobacter autotrophicus TaxID=280 RepID=UPI001AD4D38D|nr:DUF3088 domain-containing protein [Xanthobacter autotrophicus]MBN8918018.1 DUF3088 domain-containing protein [Hyphomicrobiales bacterium]UDQ90009.1 DUF3088 domain-containing protein [Xanthobacter autotrophicus]